jgi:hypothetical protein
MAAPEKLPVTAFAGLDLLSVVILLDGLIIQHVNPRWRILLPSAPGNCFTDL